MFTPGNLVVIPPMVSVFTKGLGWVTENVSGGQPGSATWVGADTAYYYPIFLPSPCIVRRVWWANGATTSGQTIECGVYSDSGYGPGAKIVSGSTTQGTASEVQFVDVTDTGLAPGLYWIALMAASTSSTTMMRIIQSDAWNAGYAFQQGSANPLPSTATPVEDASLAVYLCGFATTASP